MVVTDTVQLRRLVLEAQREALRDYVDDTTMATMVGVDIKTWRGWVARDPVLRDLGERIPADRPRFWRWFARGVLDYMGLP